MVHSRTYNTVSHYIFFWFQSGSSFIPHQLLMDIWTIFSIVAINRSLHGNHVMSPCNCASVICAGFFPVCENCNLSTWLIFVVYKVAWSQVWKENEWKCSLCHHMLARTTAQTFLLTFRSRHFQSLILEQLQQSWARFSALPGACRPFRFWNCEKQLLLLQIRAVF